MLGGVHFATYPVLKSLAEFYEKPLSLIHFDAHSDTWAADTKTIDHGTMFYHAAKEGLVDPECSAQIGIRTYNDDSHGFNIFSSDVVSAIGIAKIIEKIRSMVGENPVYLTFDIDCLDPAYAPGTGTPVVGGLSTDKALKIIRGLKDVNIVGFDLVEVNPAYDHAEITALAGATILLEYIYLLAHKKYQASL